MERVLRLKRQRERQAEQVQQQARTALEAALTEERRWRQCLQEAADAVVGRVGQPLEAAAWIDLSQHATRLGEALRRAEIRSTEAMERLRQASEYRLRASREVEVLLALRSEQFAAYRLAAARAEQQRLDETALRGWVRQQQASASALTADVPPGIVGRASRVPGERR